MNTRRTFMGLLTAVFTGIQAKVWGKPVTWEDAVKHSSPARTVEGWDVAAAKKVIEEMNQLWATEGINRQPDGEKPSLEWSDDTPEPFCWSGFMEGMDVNHTGLVGTDPSQMLATEQDDTALADVFAKFNREKLGWEGLVKHYEENPPS